MAVNKTKAGTFVADVWYRDAEGKLKRKEETFDRERDATAWHEEQRTLVRKHEFVAPSKMTVKEIATKWLTKKEDSRDKNGERSYRRSTLIQWENHIDNYIIPTFGALMVREIGAEAIEKGISSWKVAPQTANKMLTTLTAVLGLAKRYKAVRDNAGYEAERLKVATDEDETVEVLPDEVYSKDELRGLINATEPGTRERLAVMIPALTGVRVGEALALTWGAIDLKQDKLHVRLNMADSEKGAPPLFQPPKTRSSRRTIDMPQELAHELKVWKLKCPANEANERGLVLVTDDGRPLSRKTISRLLDDAITAAKIKRLTPHGLRHSFASLLLAAGADIPEVSYLLGHKDSSVTLKVYAHFVKRETRSVHKLAASILG
jgi:integrase